MNHMPPQVLMPFTRAMLTFDGIEDFLDNNNRHRIQATYNQDNGNIIITADSWGDDEEEKHENEDNSGGYNIWISKYETESKNLAGGLHIISEAMKGRSALDEIVHTYRSIDNNIETQLIEHPNLFLSAQYVKEPDQIRLGYGLKTKENGKHKRLMYIETSSFGEGFHALRNMYIPKGRINEIVQGEVKPPPRI